MQCKALRYEGKKMVPVHCEPATVIVEALSGNKIPLCTHHAQLVEDNNKGTVVERLCKC